MDGGGSLSAPDIVIDNPHQQPGNIIRIAQASLIGSLSVSGNSDINVRSLGGGLLLKAVSTSNGNINVSTAGGPLVVLASRDQNPNISTLNGNVTLITRDNSLIALNPGSNLQVNALPGNSAGVISLLVGPGSTAVVSSIPQNVIVQGSTPANIKLTNGVIAAPPDNIIDINGGHVILSSGQGFITLGGGVRITANVLAAFSRIASSPAPASVQSSVPAMSVSTTHNAAQGSGAISTQIEISPSVQLHALTPNSFQQNESATLTETLDLPVSSHLQPIGFQNLSVPECFREVKFTHAEALTFSSSCVEELQPGQLMMCDGQVVLICEKQIDIQAGSTLIRVAGGTIIFVSKNGDVLTVRNLCDNKANSVHISSTDCAEFGIAVGQQAILTPITQPAYDDVASRPRLQVTTINREITVCDYSLPSFANHSNILRQLLTSDSKGHRKIFARCLKASAAMGLITSQRGPYRRQ